MSNLKLTSINASMLNRLEMETVIGGAAAKEMWTANCACGCRYANSGGSSTSNNGNANEAHKKVSPGMKSMNQMSDADMKAAFGDAVWIK